MADEALRIFCREEMDLSMAVRDDKVVLWSANRNDKLQHWYQVFSTSTENEGQKAFALVNKFTGQVLVNNHVTVQSDHNLVHVQLAPYSSEAPMNTSMLWTLGDTDLGDGFGFREVRALRDIKWTLNGLHGNVKDGTVVGLYGSHPDRGNAVWKFTPHFANT